MTIEENNMRERLANILAVFKIHEHIIGYEEVQMGHINTTYRVYVKLDNGELKSYIVQKLNTFVFNNPKAVMKNIDLVTSYIRQISPKQALHFHHTPDGKNYYVEENNFWRLYTYKEGNAIEGNINEEVMYQCGKAFGQFQKQLDGFDASKLTEIIPDFHNTTKRYQHLLETIAYDPLDRVENCKEEIKFVIETKEIVLELDALRAIGEIPLRTTHNDTKTNNVLLDATTNEPLTVIDLDTVMPGLIMHDFGDAIRYGANTAVEDEKDLSKVSLSLPIYEAFTKGFMEQVKDILTPKEVDCMALGAATITFELAVRFLDDYLAGDKYFKISYPEHNLVRAKCQFALLKDMLKHLDEMKEIVYKYAK